MIKFYISALLLTFSFGCLAQSQADEERYNRFMKEREKVLALFRATPQLMETDRPNVIEFVERSGKGVFLVTKEGHPAHPAIVTRRVLEVNGQFAIKMDGDSGGSKEALKNWIDYMAAEDAKAVEAKRRR